MQEDLPVLRDGIDVITAVQVCLVWVMPRIVPRVQWLPIRISLGSRTAPLANQGRMETKRGYGLVNSVISGDGVWDIRRLASIVIWGNTKIPRANPSV